MVTRNSYTSLSPAFTGDQLVDDLAQKADLWFDNMSLIPTAITNTGNDYTITIDPALKTGEDVQAGMSFHVVPNVDNTGPVRLRITSSGTYYAVKKADGTNLAAGEWNQQTTCQILFINGEFRMLNSTAAGIQVGILNEQTFNSAGTWTKPDDMPTSAIVQVYIVAGGGGGGGNQSGSGGGGAGVVKEYKITDLPSTVSVTVGAGGSAGNVGGNSSFGSYITVYGGGAGGSGSGSQPAGGGGGGGISTAGSNGAAFSGLGGNGGYGGGGAHDGFVGNTTAGGKGLGGGGGGGANSGGVGDGGGATVGGGGGGGGYTTNGGSGGGSVWGGGGGASGGGLAGISVYGGNGGTNASAPTVPGGGGAGNSNTTYNTGAAGKCVVRVLA